MKKQSYLKNYILLFITAAIWGGGFVAQSSGMDYVGPFTFTASRNILAVIFLIPVILILKSTGKKNKNDKENNIPKDVYMKNTIIGGIVCGTCLFVAGSFQQVGIIYTSAGKAGFITALYVIFVPIFGMGFEAIKKLIKPSYAKKKTSWTIWISVVFAVVGLYLLCMEADTFYMGKGECLILICALCFMVQILAIDHYSPNADAVTLSCIQFFVCGVEAIVATMILEKPMLNDILAAAKPIMYAGICSSGIGYTLQVVGQKNANPTICSIIMCFESVFSVVFGTLFLHEALTVKHVLGCIIMFVAIIISQIPVNSKKTER